MFRVLTAIQITCLQQFDITNYKLTQKRKKRKTRLFFLLIFQSVSVLFYQFQFFDHYLVSTKRAEIKTDLKNYRHDTLTGTKYTDCIKIFEQIPSFDLFPYISKIITRPVSFEVSARTVRLQIWTKASRKGWQGKERIRKVLQLKAKKAPPSIWGLAEERISGSRSTLVALNELCIGYLEGNPLEVEVVFSLTPPELLFACTRAALSHLPYASIPTVFLFR